MDVRDFGGAMRSTSRWLTICGGLALVATACTFTRQGNLTRVPSGPAIPISVAVGADSARVTGTDPATGERLDGTFHLDRGERPPSPIGVPGPAPAIGGGAVSPGTGPRPATGRPAVLDLKGRLEGDKGTSVRCALQIKKGLRLEGVGVCRAADDDEAPVVYRIRF